MTARQSIFYLASLLCAVLAMKTKENAFTLPVMIALYEFFFFGGPVRKRVLHLIPFMLTMLIIPLTLIGIDKPIGEIIGGVGPAMGGSGEISRADYLFTQFRVVVTYIRLLFLPVNQNIDYDYPVYGSFFNMQVFLSFSFLLSLLGLAFYLLRLSRYRSSALRLIAFGIFWFFITLSVESSIIPLPMAINEYRLYLPSTGAFTAAAVGVALALRNRSRKLQTAIALLSCLAVVALSSAAYSRNAVWKSEISLWEDVVKKSPQNARGHCNIGVAYASEGFIDNAIVHLQAATKLKPEIADVHYNLGLAYQKKGWINEARKEFEYVLYINPDDSQAKQELNKLSTPENLADK